MYSHHVHTSYLYTQTLQSFLLKNDQTPYVRGSIVHPRANVACQILLMAVETFILPVLCVEQGIER